MSRKRKLDEQRQRAANTAMDASVARAELREQEAKEPFVCRQMTW
jgi:hypothetical protein